VGQSDTGGQTGETGSDDDDVEVGAGLQLFAARELNFGVRYSAQLSSDASFG
jgi:hypothetical protein